MHNADWLDGTSAAFRLVLATSWLAPDDWRDRQREAVLACVAAGVDWNEYVQLVDRHLIPALSWAVLSRNPDAAVPEQIKLQLRTRSDECRMEAVRQTLILASVLRGLSSAGIPVMPFKGQVLSCDIYGAPGLRQSRDLDIAVPPDRLDHACACLEKLGWEIDCWMPSAPRQWQTYLRHEHHLYFKHPQSGCVLELHWRNDWETPEETRARWERSIASDWQGCPIQAMASGDLTLYLCSHGAGHAWALAKWLGDMARGHAIGYFDWTAAVDEARRTGQESVVLVTLDLLAEVYGLPLPFSGSALTYPLFVKEIARENLSDPAGPLPPEAVNRRRLRMSRYKRLLRPRTSWRDSVAELFYCRADLKVLPLPDSLSWAYVPLRPFLWLWRTVTRSGYEVYK